MDEKETEVERLCLKIILKQQPVASDLLFVTSAMKMVTDMERIADPGGGHRRSGRQDEPASVCGYSDGDLRHGGARQRHGRLRGGELCRAQHGAAKETCRADDAVDDLFDAVKKKLTHVMYKDIDDDENGEQALDMLMIANTSKRSATTPPTLPNG